MTTSQANKSKLVATTTLSLIVLTLVVGFFGGVLGAKTAKKIPWPKAAEAIPQNVSIADDDLTSDTTNSNLESNAEQDNSSANPEAESEEIQVANDQSDDGIYNGFLSNNQRNGLGRLDQADKSCIYGFWKDGLLDGYAMKYDGASGLITYGLWSSGNLSQEFATEEDFLSALPDSKAFLYYRDIFKEQYKGLGNG
jgi:hypothetical protein